MADTGRLDELQRKFDENPRRFFAPLANEYRKAGNLERSIELCREYLPQQPGHMSGYIVYGQALFDGGRYDEAIEAFKQALAIDPENIIALKHLGDIAKRNGERDVAAKWYRRVIELDRKNEAIEAYLADSSATESVSTRQTATGASSLQTVYPEPAPDPDAVALSDLVTQPDVPVTSTPIFSVTETRSNQFGAAGDNTVDMEEAKAVFDQMLADHHPIHYTAPNEPEGVAAPNEAIESLAELPLITEFTMSVRSVRTVAEDVTEPVFPELQVVEPPAAQSHFPDPWTSEPHVAEPASRDAAPEPQEQEQPEPAPAAAVSEFDTPFVTETMADLYLQQGFSQQALDVYRRLATNSDEPQLRDKIDNLERSIRARETHEHEVRVQEAMAQGAVTQEAVVEQRGAAREEAGATRAPVVPTITVREFFARIGARRPQNAITQASTEALRSAGELGTLFGSTQIDEGDARAASALGSAFTPAR